MSSAILYSIIAVIALVAFALFIVRWMWRYANEDISHEMNSIAKQDLQTTFPSMEIPEGLEVPGQATQKQWAVTHRE